MPEYFRPYNFPSDITQKRMDLENATPNIGAEIVKQLGNVGTSYFKSKKEKKDKEDETNLKLSFEAFKGIADGNLEIDTEKVKDGKVDYNRLHELVKPTPNAGRKKDTVAEDAKPANDATIDMINSQLPKGAKKIEYGVSLAQAKALMQASTITFKQKQVAKEDIDSLEKEIKSLKVEKSKISEIDLALQPFKVTRIDEINDDIAIKEQEYARLTGKPITQESVKEEVKPLSKTEQTPRALTDEDKKAIDIADAYKKKLAASNQTIDWTKEEGSIREGMSKQGIIGTLQEKIIARLKQ